MMYVITRSRKFKVIHATTAEMHYNSSVFSELRFVGILCRFNLINGWFVVYNV